MTSELLPNQILHLRQDNKSLYKQHCTVIFCRFLLHRQNNGQSVSSSNEATITDQQLQMKLWSHVGPEGAVRPVKCCDVFRVCLLSAASFQALISYKENGRAAREHVKSVNWSSRTVSVWELVALTWTHIFIKRIAHLIIFISDAMMAHSCY